MLQVISSGPTLPLRCTSCHIYFWAKTHHILVLLSILPLSVLTMLPHTLWYHWIWSNTIHTSPGASETHFLKLPTHLQKHWIDSLCKELKTILKNSIFSKEESDVDEPPVIPATVKLWTKLDVQGLIDNLKSCICYRNLPNLCNFLVKNTFVPVTISFGIFAV